MLTRLVNSVANGTTQSVETFLPVLVCLSMLNWIQNWICPIAVPSQGRVIFVHQKIYHFPEKETKKEGNFPKCIHHHQKKKRLNHSSRFLLLLSWLRLITKSIHGECQLLYCLWWNQPPRKAHNWWPQSTGRSIWIGSDSNEVEIELLFNPFNGIPEREFKREKKKRQNLMVMIWLWYLHACQQSRLSWIIITT